MADPLGEANFIEILIVVSTGLTIAAPRIAAGRRSCSTVRDAGTTDGVMLLMRMRSVNINENYSQQNCCSVILTVSSAMNSN
ncbi:hypothetical protein BN2475_540026 [Paraburkholderia ribeironis]|uniref:Uncharacterized protein n=1 Tax=Paraburkholderia ribeironis TaxID=1247936 RepID=A0A1N7SCZ1_9BURK|nr:hypothetical protein BN2475_540026 [Paraburkholderia ribeironis]